MSTNVSDWNPWRSPPRASARNVHESADPSAGCKARVIGETCQRTFPIGIRGAPRPVLPPETFTNRPVRPPAAARRSSSAKHANGRFRLESVALLAPCFRPKRSRIGWSVRRRLQGARHRRNMPTDASDWNPWRSPPRASARNAHESACPSAGGSRPMTSTSSATTATEPSSSSLSSIGENSGLSGASVILTCLQPSSPAVFSLR